MDKLISIPQLLTPTTKKITKVGMTICICTAMENLHENSQKLVEPIITVHKFFGGGRREWFLGRCDVMAIFWVIWMERNFTFEYGRGRSWVISHSSAQ